jgi:hypothetical protein
LIFLRSGVRALAFLGLLVALPGCDRDQKAEEIFLLAADALPVEAHQERARVVNPRLLEQNNPRMGEGVLVRLRDAGYEVLGTGGLEDPEKATYYFTDPDTLEGNRYRIYLYVSLGARVGTMQRGDTWWRVDLECPEACRVVGVAPTGGRGWGRTSPVG